jgi:hypothetical protein
MRVCNISSSLGRWPRAVKRHADQVLPLPHLVLKKSRVEPKKTRVIAVYKNVLCISSALTSKKNSNLQPDDDRFDEGSDVG